MANALHALRPALPDVPYTLLDGRKTSTAVLRGKVVLVNFWAPSCPPCTAELPQLVDLQRALQPRGFDTVAVAVDRDPPANVMYFVETQGLALPVAIDLSGDFAHRYGDVRAIPTSVLIDRHGRQAARYEGRLDVPAVRRLIEQLLAET